MKLSKNSLHYKFNLFCDDNYIERKHTKDFCSYFWHTLFNMFKVGFMLSVALVVLTVLIIAWKQTLAIILAVSLFVGIIALVKHTNEKLEDTPKGFVRASYSKFREKTCHKIDWE